MIYSIKTHYEQGDSIHEISRKLKIHRTTVRKYLEQIKTIGVVGPVIQKEKKLDRHKGTILEWLEKGLTARLIHNKLIELHSVEISYPTVARYVNGLKSNTEVYVPMISKPAQEAQVDYGYIGQFEKDGRKIKPWCFVMTLSHSRYHYVEIVTNQSVESFINSHINAFEYFGGVPKTVKIDNLKAGVTIPNFYEPTIQHQYAEFLYHYKSAPVTARVRRPQDKGKVEAGVKYVKNNFIKGTFEKDFYKLKNGLTLWLEKSNNRIHGTTKKVPENQFIQIEKENLLKLPGQRFEIFSIAKRKADNYAHIVFLNNYYSAPYKYAGKTLIIKYNQNIIKIFDNQEQIALHTICKTQGEYITQDAHKPPEKQYKNKEYYLNKCSVIGQNAYLFGEKLIEEKPYHYMNMINGISSLAKKYSNPEVDLACKRALLFNAISYSTIKNICEKSISQIKNEILSVENSAGYAHDLKTYDNLLNQK